jgi:cytochrome c-type biogenesis protein CcmE
MQTRNTIFTLTMPFAIIRSQVNESSGEAICRLCGVITQASQQVSASSEFSEKVTSGSRNIRITYQGRSAYTVSIMEFRDGKVVHETQYFADPFEAPAWRSKWVQQMA